MRNVSLAQTQMAAVLVSVVQRPPVFFFYKFVSHVFAIFKIKLAPIWERVRQQCSASHWKYQWAYAKWIGRMESPPLRTFIRAHCIYIIHTIFAFTYNCKMILCTTYYNNNNIRKLWPILNSPRTSEMLNILVLYIT